jgi:hypothetical protein
MFLFSSLLSFSPLAEPGPACLTPDMMEPGFFAVSMPYGQDVTPWYERVFSAVRVRRNESRSDSGYADILRSGSLVIELIYHQEPLSRDQLAPGSRLIQWSGLVKAGPAVRADLRQVSECLERRGVEILWLVSDAEAGMDNLRIAAPNGVAIDIIARH